jgi:hypothetical protein
MDYRLKNVRFWQNANVPERLARGINGFLPRKELRM